MSKCCKNDYPPTVLWWAGPTQFRKTKMGTWRSLPALVWYLLSLKKLLQNLTVFRVGFWSSHDNMGQTLQLLVQITRHLQLVRPMFGSDSPQRCRCALSMSDCAILRQTPEWLPGYHSLLNSEKSLERPWLWDKSFPPVDAGKREPVRSLPDRLCLLEQQLDCNSLLEGHRQAANTDLH